MLSKKLLLLVCKCQTGCCRVPLQRRYVMRDMRIVRANLEAKYRLGKSLSYKPVLSDSPVPLAKYVDVSMSLKCTFSKAKSSCFVALY